MKIAYVLSTGKGDVNRVLTALSAKLIGDGLKVVGAVQKDTPRENSHKCDMDVQVLPDGDTIRISQDLGPNSSGCHLNPGALENAVEQTAQRLANADILIVNKYGKHEAEGRGFRDVIAEAVGHEIPVIVGTNSLNIEAFHAFCGAEAECVDTEVAALARWAHEACASLEKVDS